MKILKKFWKIHLGVASKNINLSMVPEQDFRKFGLKMQFFKHLEHRDLNSGKILGTFEVEIYMKMALGNFRSVSEKRQKIQI
mgnify:CR=1 FL=1